MHGPSETSRKTAKIHSVLQVEIQSGLSDFPERIRRFGVERLSVT